MQPAATEHLTAVDMLMHVSKRASDGTRSHAGCVDATLIACSGTTATPVTYSSADGKSSKANLEILGHVLVRTLTAPNEGDHMPRCVL